jgi:hypothetical protein
MNGDSIGSKPRHSRVTELSKPSTYKVIGVIILAFTDPTVTGFDLCPGRCSYMLNSDLNIATITDRLMHQLMIQNSPVYHEIGTYQKVGDINTAYLIVGYKYRLLFGTGRSSLFALWEVPTEY